jgi:GAF domain-containing protein
VTPKKPPNETLRKLALISEAGNALHSILNLDELLEKILSIVQKVFCLDNCAILILDRKTNELFIWKERGYNPKVVKTFRAKPGVGVTGWVVETGQPTLIENVRKDSRYIPGVKGANSEMAVPLRIGETVIGVLDAESKKSGCFTEEDLTMFAIFASQAATAIQHVKLLSELSNKIEDLERKTVGLQLGQNLSHVIAQARNYRNLIEELI